MIKAIFFDIDGTLVPFNAHGVPYSTRQAIRELRRKGILVFICTGRPLQYIDNLEGVERDGMIVVTGALCLDAQGQVLGEHTIPQSDVKALLTHLDRQEQPTCFIAVGKDRMYANHLHSAEVDYILQLLNVPKQPYLPLEQAALDSIYQIIGFFHKEDEEVMQQVLPHCACMRWHELFADIIAQGVSKSAGIDTVIRHYGIQRSETMAFGDGGNDIPMLDHAGISIAMGNASDEVKRHAHYVTAAVDDDGIVKALQHFGLL